MTNTVSAERRLQDNRSETRAVLRDLAHHAQSVWLNCFHRDMIRSGELSALVADGLAGLTCNPTIFSHVTAGISDYDNIIGAYASSTATDRQILDAIVTRDVQDAADVFLRTYESTAGADGFVSIDVAPGLARNANALIAEARRLWRAVDRPNVMIKIPGTREAWPAIERCVHDGINVNITLVCSVEQYRAAATALVRALDARIAMGQTLDRVASACSVFLAPIDREVNRRIDARGLSLTPVRGMAAIANAWLIYATYLDIAESARWKPLEERGAKLPRPVWVCASNGSEDNSGAHYAESLVAAGTVAAISPAALHSVHVPESPALSENIADAQRTMDALARGGINFADVCRTVIEGGVWTFNSSLDKLLGLIDHKRKILGGRTLNFFQ
ncbi:MAG TPA: transaldolase family protein [Gemmatimonadaceae bacterium]|nr:transaldolase family protein [Gemmatimonadaceae bacterium]